MHDFQSKTSIQQQRSEGTTRFCNIRTSKTVLRIRKSLDASSSIAQQGYERIVRSYNGTFSTLVRRAGGGCKTEKQHGSVTNKHQTRWQWYHHSSLVAEGRQKKLLIPTLRSFFQQKLPLASTVDARVLAMVGDELDGEENGCTAGIEARGASFVTSDFINATHSDNLAGISRHAYTFWSRDILRFHLTEESSLILSFIILAWYYLLLR